MRKVLIFLAFTFILGIGNFKSLYASHFAGSDLTYVCLGGNTYRVTFTFYRDCSGIPMEPTEVLNCVCSTNPAYNFTTTLNQIPGTGQEITWSCNAAPTTCSNGNHYGIREFVFEAVITLPPCDSWTLSVTYCCRNATTVGTGMPDWFMKANLNNLIAPCNSSPTFSNKPVAIVCNQQNFCFNHGAVDPEGDSLSYSFYAPFTIAATNTVTYNFPYGYTNFLQSSYPISLDSITGDICFLPTQLLRTITGIKVDEWRTINGVPTIIGTVHRDIQLTVIQCINQIPILSGIDTLLTGHYNPNDSIYYMEKCLSNDPIKFHINGNDSDIYDTNIVGNPEKFHISWNNGIPGATFTTHYNGTDSAYAEFIWLPTTADVSNTPKCFTATIRDEACPYYGSQTFSYCLVIRGMLVDIGSDTLLCEGESITVNAIADTSTVNYIWKINGVPTSTPLNQDYYIVNTSSLGPGTHVLSIETNDGSTTMACPGTDDDTIVVVYQPHINTIMLDTALCNPDSVKYDAGYGQIYRWTDFSGNILSNTQFFSSSLSGIYNVFVDGGINTRCIDRDTFEIVSIDIPKLGFDTCIWDEDAPFQLDIGYSNPAYIYTWNTGDNTQIISINQSGIYGVSVSHKTISPSVKCYSDITVNIIDRSEVIVSKLYQANENIPMPDEVFWKEGDRLNPDSAICLYQRIGYKGPDAPIGHAYDYSWKRSNSIVSSNKMYIFKH